MATRVPMRLAMRIRNPVMPGYLHSGGTDDGTSVSPFRGSINRPKDLSRSLEIIGGLVSKERRTLLWIVFLSAACFVTAVAFGPLAALAVGVVANALDFRRPYLRWAIYIPARGLTGAVVGLTAAQVITPHASFGTATLATVGAGVANFLFDSLFNVGTLAVRRSAPVSVYTRSVGPLTLLSLPLYVPLVGLMVFGYQHYSFWTAAMFLGPTLALQRVVHLYQKQRDVSDELTEANERLEAANISFATALVTTLDARDPIRRVTRRR